MFPIPFPFYTACTKQVKHLMDLGTLVWTLLLCNNFSRSIKHKHSLFSKLLLKSSLEPGRSQAYTKLCPCWEFAGWGWCVMMHKCWLKWVLVGHKLRRMFTPFARESCTVHAGKSTHLNAVLWGGTSCSIEVKSIGEKWAEHPEMPADNFHGSITSILILFYFLFKEEQHSIVPPCLAWWGLLWAANLVETRNGVWAGAGRRSEICLICAAQEVAAGAAVQVSCSMWRWLRVLLLLSPHCCVLLFPHCCWRGVVWDWSVSECGSCV